MHECVEEASRDESWVGTMFAMTGERLLVVTATDSEVMMMVVVGGGAGSAADWGCVAVGLWSSAMVVKKRAEQAVMLVEEADETRRDGDETGCTIPHLIYLAPRCTLRVHPHSTADKAGRNQLRVGRDQNRS